MDLLKIKTMKENQLAEILEKAFLIFEIELNETTVCFKKLDEALDYKNVMGGKVIVKQVYTYKQLN